ncbi:hypothetical protein EGM51_12320 [Verrucomicrobia bacterium S94]|nr:hypothetical protein EGM51_12320 [Verrucomicrobia bacterium S94]
MVLRKSRNGACTGDRVDVLEENGRYEYEVLSEDYALKEKPGMIRPSCIANTKARGLIEPGNYVGLLKLELLNTSSGKSVAKI